MAGKIQHMLERDGRYFARLVIPVSLRPFLNGKTELRTPLGGDRKEAKAKFAGALASLQTEIGVARRRANAGEIRQQVTGLHPMSVADMARRDYQEQIAFDQEIRTHDYRYAAMGVDYDGARLFRDGYSGKLNDETLSALVGDRIERLRLRGNTTAERGTPEWRALAQAICASSYEALSRQDERDEGNFTGSPDHPVLAQSTPDEELDPVSINGLLDDYLKELERGGRGAAARQRWTPVFASLVGFAGHDDANRLTKRNILDWKEYLATTLAARTIRDVHMASLRAVMKWAAENEKIPVNPAATVRTKVPKAVRAREKGYRDDEALAILRFCRSYIPPLKESAAVACAKRWAPFLCAFTGARIVEITQLRKEDIRDENGVPIIRIDPDAGSVKSGQYRDIPLHRQLIELGFLDFAMAQPAGPLFHASKPGKALLGARTTAGRISNWLRASGLVPDGVSPNHAWRHRFKTTGLELEISGRVLDAIQDHAARTAGESYGDVTIATKRNALEKFPSYYGLA